MALIKCPECGKEISDKAKSCINCGYPLAEVVTTGTVRIKIPNNVLYGVERLFSSHRAVVVDSNGKILWEGKHGEIASFIVDGPTAVRIELGRMAYAIEGTVNPCCRYSLVLDAGIHMLATYILTEVDVIDSD